MPRVLIVNADDLGYADGVNSGIAEAHDRGIVTSTSLMVLAPAAEEGARLAHERPRLGLGLHLDLDSPWAARVDRGNDSAVLRELRRQIAAFHELTGGAPSHIDGHHHAHLDPLVRPVAVTLAEGLAVPLRAVGPVRFIGDFDARPQPGPSDLARVSPEALISIIERLEQGWSELMCHPGRPDPALRSAYTSEREAELQTLTDDRVRAAVDAAGIRLATWSGAPMA